MEFCGFLFWTVLCILVGYAMQKEAKRRQQEDESEDE